MNYRHSFHAGNFADVFKHILLTRILAHLLKKTTPLRYIDTHSGAGFYDLAGAAAARSPEWQSGVARLARGLDGLRDRAVKDLLAPYLHCLGPFDAAGRPSLYPGSPAIARHMLRAQDRMTFCELHKGDVKELARAVGRDRRAKVIAIDGYTALNAYVPPRERRGLVLIDPPFEDRGEFERLETGVASAVKKWPTGVYALWYPVKQARQARGLAEGLGAEIGRPMLVTEFFTGEAALREARGLTGCGLIVINPPHTLESEARLLLPFLSAALGQEGGGAWAISPVNKA